MNQDDSKSIWVFTPRFQDIGHDKLMDSLQNDLLQTVLAVIQDGICILDKDLNIIYANPTMCCWYPGFTAVKRQKCYQVYHNRANPCDVCPTLRTFESKLPETDIVAYDREPDAGGWQRLYSVPVLDSGNNVVLVIEYIRDITHQRKAELTSEFFESQNTMLIDFLEQKQKEKEALERTIVTNVELSIKPILNYLDKTVGKENTDIVRRQLDTSLKRLTHNKSQLASVLTPRELQIAALIKENYLSKEIADQLVISKKTVDYHRTSIRKKLNLKPNDNLQGFLETNM